MMLFVPTVWAQAGNETDPLQGKPPPAGEPSAPANAAPGEAAAPLATPENTAPAAPENAAPIEPLAPPHEAPPTAEAAAHEGSAHEGGEAHHEGIDSRLLMFQVINFTIFFVVLVYFARKPIMNALGNRSSAVRRDLDESAKLRDDAESRYHEIERKLAGLDKRIDDMKAEAALEAAAEQARIAERAEADAARIKETAERTIREEALRARNEIRKEVVEQASGLAVGMVKQAVNVDDQIRLQNELLQSLKRGGEA